MRKTQVALAALALMASTAALATEVKIGVLLTLVSATPPERAAPKGPTLKTVATLTTAHSKLTFPRISVAA